MPEFQVAVVQSAEKTYKKNRKEALSNVLQSAIIPRQDIYNLAQELSRFGPGTLILVRPVHR